MATETQFILYHMSPHHTVNPQAAFVVAGEFSEGQCKDDSKWLAWYPRFITVVEDRENKRYNSMLSSLISSMEPKQYTTVSACILQLAELAIFDHQQL